VYTNTNSAVNWYSVNCDSKSMNMARLFQIQTNIYNNYTNACIVYADTCLHTHTYVVLDTSTNTHNTCRPIVVSTFPVIAELANHLQPWIPALRPISSVALFQFNLPALVVILDRMSVLVVPGFECSHSSRLNKL